MSVSITNPTGTSPVIADVPGASREATAKITFDSSYPTGGEVLSPSLFGLQQIDSVTSGVSLVGKLVTPVFASGVWKLKVYVSSTDTEVANTTNLSADSVVLTVRGK